MAGTDGVAGHDPVAVARQFGEQVPHSRDLGMQVLTMEADQVRMRLVPGPDLHADDAADELCSSVLFSLVDSACGLAVFAAIQELTPIATLDLRMDYLRPAGRERALMASARCHHWSDDVAFVRCQVFSEGLDGPVAIGNATFMRATQGRHFESKASQGNAA
ncbi:MAG: PaaI family thioesterase [Abyssibacter sp.]|jgi:acyl-coenzyme A thioesterase PaaI-like protein|uniref:PaaI family thioesterase n=1 Tax=Abyssibacter profundi TaxID=2182787 RepID=A0A383XRN1_9GAMM|nr:PaaI family thioesterase [Abyssibacter profundi]